MVKEVQTQQELTNVNVRINPLITKKLDELVSIKASNRNVEFRKAIIERLKKYNLLEEDKRYL